VTRAAAAAAATAAGVTAVFLLGGWLLVRWARNAVLTSAALVPLLAPPLAGLAGLLAFALLPASGLGAAGQETPTQKFAHLAVEKWDAKACVLITYSEHNHAHLFFRCNLPEDVRGHVIAPRGLHVPAQPVATQEGVPGSVAFITVGWKAGGGPVIPKSLAFRLWRMQIYLAVEPEGKCPAGAFHNSSGPKSQS